MTCATGDLSFFKGSMITFITKTIRNSIASIPGLFKKSLKELLKNDPLRMAGATAFFTTFALPPILVILIQALRLILDPRTIRVQLFKNLREIIGPEAVKQLVDVLVNLHKMAQNWYITLGGFIFLLFVATTLFKVIKNSINQVWMVRPHKRKGVMKGLHTRIQSLLILLIAAILFLIGIVMEGARTLASNYIFEFSPLLSLYFKGVLNQVVSVLVVMIWFMMVFRYLPDARPEWKVALVGALVTSLLFTAGKIILHCLLRYSSINNVYGASASLVLLLLFVFYSSLILYFGASFTMVWGEYKKRPITPLPYAAHYRLTEEEVIPHKA
jgi:membrane protein